MGFPPPVPSTFTLVMVAIVVAGLPGLLIGLGLGWLIWG